VAGVPTTHHGHLKPTELSHCTLTLSGHKPSTRRRCNQWPPFAQMKSEIGFAIKTTQLA